MTSRPPQVAPDFLLKVVAFPEFAQRRGPRDLLVTQQLRSVRGRRREIVG